MGSSNAASVNMPEILNRTSARSAIASQRSVRSIPRSPSCLRAAVPPNRRVRSVDDPAGTIVLHCCRRGGTRRAGSCRRHWLDEEHVVTELPEPQQVLEHRPRRSAVIRIGRNHSRAEHRQPASSHGAFASSRSGWVRMDSIVRDRLALWRRRASGNSSSRR